ncbi:LOW QUALITY PROTEIN: hypothetical protein PoB_001967200 [Plakobranchus ocellatus]|uniref:Uncharacterized protein n=1 Tax=Plakobranchus ocellatus TaxID=259542 RepID=A0AAV3ZCY9_9GAST|nr:LOW QUALITY PROTEIN: hypothetical protein PoB_001967200 [Plakobranchus ocellatus]
MRPHNRYKIASVKPQLPSSRSNNLYIFLLMLRAGKMLMVAGVYDGQLSRLNLMYWQLVQIARLLQDDFRLQCHCQVHTFVPGRNIRKKFSQRATDNPHNLGSESKRNGIKTTTWRSSPTTIRIEITKQNKTKKKQKTIRCSSATTRLRTGPKLYCLPQA